MDSSAQDKFSLTDEALMEMLRLDHQVALKEIFARYHSRLFRLAAGVLNDEEIAKDIVQDIFIDLWNRRHSSGIRVLSHYLTRATKFQVLKQLRNGRLKEHHLKQINDIQFANQTEESIDGAELENMLDKAVRGLSPRCREVFRLSRFENLSHKEISSRLNISTKTVEAQITKALAALRQKLHLILPGLMMVIL